MIRVACIPVSAVIVALLLVSGAGDARAQWGCQIVGYAHPFDIVPIPVCNGFGICQQLPQQIPCQHPLWSCY
jgi:hypothetical protein